MCEGGGACARTGGGPVGPSMPPGPFDQAATPVRYCPKLFPKGGTMSAIVPVHMGESGPKVAILHRGLLYLIRYNGSVTDGMRAAFEMQLAHDRIPHRFGSATASIVGIYQAQLKSRAPRSEERRVGKE